MARVYVRGAARLDLIDRYAYLAEHASVDVAERFFANAEISFTNPSRQPTIGTPLTLTHAELAGMRKWSIDGFENALIFYQARPDGVSIVRVLHAAQDWWSLLGMVT
jgi:toxin ParE1/3/4